MKELSLILEQHADRICELMAHANEYQSANLDSQYYVCFDVKSNKAHIVTEPKGEPVEQFSTIANDFFVLKTYASEYNTREEQDQALCDYMQAKINAETPKEAVGRILGRLPFADRSTFQNVNCEHPEWGDDERLDYLVHSFPPIEYTPKDILSQQELNYTAYELRDEFKELVNAASSVKVCDEKDKYKVKQLFSPELSISVELDPSFFSRENMSALKERFDKGGTGSNSFEAFVEARARKALDERVAQSENDYMSTHISSLTSSFEKPENSEAVQLFNHLKDVEGYTPRDFFHLANGKVTVMDEVALIKAVENGIQAYMDADKETAKATHKSEISRD